MLNERPRAFCLAAVLTALLGTTPPVHAGVDPEACCLPNLSCVDLPAEDCDAVNGTPLGTGTTCAINGSVCSMQPIPAAGEWGLVAMFFVLLIAGSIMLRQPAQSPHARQRRSA